MANNNPIGEKFKFQDLPGVPDNQKLTATKFNTLVDFQNSPVQQISGSLDDTDIVIDGTKNYATTIVEAGATRTITANASGHKQGNNLKQRYTFDVDCALTLSGFDATGNNTGQINSLLAGTYDFIFQANRNGINLLILQNTNTLISGIAALDGSSPVVVQIASIRSSSSWIEDADVAGLDFYSSDSSGRGPNVRSAVRMYTEDTFGSRYGLKFFVDDNASFIEGMRIDPDGNLLIGGNILADGQITVQGKVVTFTATPTFDLDDGNVQEMILTSNVTSLTLSNKLDAGNYLIYLIQDGTGGHTIPTPDSSWGDPTDNSVDPSNFLTGANDRNLINVAVSPSGFTEYSIETHNI